MGTMDCLFCSIIAGDVPSRQVYADDTAIAFLDIAPFKRGHTLVVPRRHVSDFVSDPATWGEITPAIEQTTTILSDTLGCAGMNLFSSAGTVAGQEIFHLHVHLVPRYDGQPGLRALFERDEAAGEDLDGLHRQLTQ